VLRRLRGDPNLAPRCGAKTRAGLACRAPAMKNARCRMHGGKSTGPRTAEGLARLAQARTTHGAFNAASRAMHLHQRTAIVRCRVFVMACELETYLSPDIAARVELGGKELAPPPRPFRRPVARDADKSPCNVVPPGRVVAKRDARGRFVARLRAVARGRQGEREAARAEVAMLAPWRAGIVRARLVKRWVAMMRKEARIARRGQKPMHLMAVGSGTGPLRLGKLSGGRSPAIAECAGDDKNPMHPTAVRSGTALVRLGKLSGGDGTAIPECAGADKNPIQPIAVRSGTGPLRRGLLSGGGSPAIPECAGADKNPMQPTAVRSGTGPLGHGKLSGGGGPAISECAGADKNPIHPTTVRPVTGPFRRRLLSSAVCNTATAHKLVAQVERGGGWTVLMAIDAAKQAGEDWRPRVAETRQRLADEAARLRTSCMLQVGSVAGIVRWDNVHGGA
jgi:hypothetical protein